jgi:hypothetical protein
MAQAVGSTLIALVAGIKSSDDRKCGASTIPTRCSWHPSMLTLPRNDVRLSLIKGDKGGARKLQKSQ